MQKKKSILISLFALVMAACLAFGLFLSLPKKAEAVSPSSSHIVLNDIVNEKGEVKHDEFLTLLQKISGDNSNNAWQTISNTITGTQNAVAPLFLPDGLPTAWTADTMRANAGGTSSKELIVTFGDKAWNPVYLTRARNKADGSEGDVILTLLLSEAETRVKYSPITSTKSSEKYPRNMYSSSYIRSYLVGTQYSTSGSSLDATASGPWVDFNKDTSKFGKWLVAPKEVQYQEVESWANLVSTHHTLPNDAYGKPCKLNWAKAGYDYGGWSSNTNVKDGYNSWQEDLLWIPSLAECGTATTPNANEGIWHLDAAQRRSGELQSGDTSNYWLRSSYTDTTVIYCIGDGKRSTGGTTNEFLARPALHLNLSKMQEAYCAVPEDFEETYSGAQLDKNIVDFDALDCEFDTTSQSNGASYDDSTGTFSATNAGEYILKATPKSGLKWADGSAGQKDIKFTIKPAKITVTVPSNAGKQNEFGKDVHLPYSSNVQVTYKMGFPDDKIPPADYSIISLISGATADDKSGIKIEYFIREHEETLEEHNSVVSDVESKINSGYYKTASGFVGQDDGSLTISANTYKGYCVVYRISAPNHETEVGYLSVHVVKETLTIEMAQDIESLVFGGDFQTQQKLHEIVEKAIKSVKDDNGEWRYSPNNQKDDGTQIDNPLVTSKFYFYLTKDGKTYLTSDDVGGTTQKWEAGEYELGVRYSLDPDEQELIGFEWSSGSAPKVKIEPKKVKIEWTGNTQYSADSGWNEDYKKGASSESDLPENGFCWIYDEDTHELKAQYTDINGGKKDATVSVAGNKADVNEYTATASITDKNYEIDTDGATGTQKFKIIKAKNSWTKDFTCAGWSIGAEDKESTRSLAEPRFGQANMVEYVYHKNTAENPDVYASWDDVLAIEQLDSDATIVVTYTLAGNDNYDDLEGGPATFKISKCAHNVAGFSVVYIPCVGDPQHADMHYFNCPICHTDVYQNHRQEAEYGHNASEHYKVCSVCKAQYGNEGHTFNIPVSETDATCEAAGSKVTKCFCGEQKTETLQKLAHTEVTDEAVEATCTTKGKTEGSHCSVCNTVITPQLDVDMKPHTEVEDKGYEATCTATGLSDGKHCSVCNTVLVEQTEIAMKPHTIVDDPAEPASCTKTGLTAGSHCSVCNTVIKAQEEVPMLEHIVNYSTTIEATCTTAGLEEGKCALCGEEQKRTVAAFGHSCIKHERVEPTATDDGSIEYYECSQCNKCYRDEEGNVEIERSDIILPALGTGNSGTGNGGGEGSVNPPLGGDTGLSSGSDDINEFFKKNWWWMLAIAVFILLIVILLIVWSVVRSRRRDKQLDTLIKMQMVHSYGGGMPTYRAAAPDNMDGAAVEGQPQAQLPFNQEMFDAAVAAAVKSALTAIKSGDEEGAAAAENIDVDGFYDDYTPPEE